MHIAMLARGISTIYWQTNPCHPTGILTCQDNSHPSNIIWITWTFQRVTAIQILPRSQMCRCLLEDGGLGVYNSNQYHYMDAKALQLLTSRAECISMDLIRSIIEGNLPRELANRSFGCTIRSYKQLVLILTDSVD